MIAVTSFPLHLFLLSLLLFHSLYFKYIAHCSIINIFIIDEGSPAGIHLSSQMAAHAQ